MASKLMKTRFRNFCQLCAGFIVLGTGLLAQQAQSTVSSANTTITYGQAFTPPYYGGSGTGNWQFCIGGYTNWNPTPNGPAGTDIPGVGYSTSWTPPGAGTYSFYIAKCGDNTYATSNYSGWWTLTVNPAPQPGVSSSNATINVGQSFSPSYSGGAGSGNWQFVVGGYTNWSPSVNGSAGTNIPGVGWSTSWTPGGPGNYSFYVAKCGDSNWQTSGNAGPYNLTVNPYLTVNNGSGSGWYSAGGSASISANAPPPNQVFSSWSQSGPGSLGSSTSKSTTFTMGSGSSIGNATVTANYRNVNFTWNPAPTSAAVNSSYTIGVGSDCPGNPYMTLYKNGFYLSGSWTGTQASTSDASAGTASFQGRVSDSYYGVSASSDWSVNIYNPSYSLTTNINPAGAGSISLNPSGGTYASGTSVTAAESPAGSYVFLNWSGDASGSSSSVTLTMNSNRSITANFGYTLTTSVTTAGTGTVSGAGNYPANGNATVTATPAAGYTFTGWSGALTGTTNPANIAMTGPKSVTATFAPATSAPTITQQPSSQTVNAGASVSFSVAATGNPAPGYQWRKNGSNISDGGNISGTTTATLTITNAQAGDAAQYSCYVSNSQGNVTSNAATLTVVAPPAVASGSSTASTSNSFSYQINATNSPTSYNATGLPAGLNLNSSTGLISGTPTVGGTFNIGLSATNSVGTGNGTLQLTISFSAADLTSTTYQYDGTNQLKHDGSGQYNADAESNIQSTGP